MTDCKNCNNTINDNFCSNCGQAATIKRIDNHYISHEVFHLLHFEKGFFYTVKQLMTRPGHSIREFIDENRSKHMKPIAFLILTSLLYSLVAHLFHADEINNGKEKLEFGQTVAYLQKWVQSHYGYANIMMGGFIALCVKLLFRKSKYNLFEITILLCFVMGQGMLLLTFLSFFVNVLNIQLYLSLISIIALAYPTWAIGQFFESVKVWSYIKAFFAYLFGYLFFYIFIILIGIGYDLIIKTL